MRGLFLLYAGAGLVVWLLYRKLPTPPPHQRAALSELLGVSRPIVLRLAALFSVDAFAGGMVVNSLLALWLFQRFDLSLSAAGSFFFWAGLLQRNQSARKRAKPRLRRPIAVQILAPKRRPPTKDDDDRNGSGAAKDRARNGTIAIRSS
jgi:hypothetical protein